MTAAFTDPTMFWGELPVVFDGAISSELYNRGCPFEDPPERWAADNPGVLEQIHTAYVATGARVVTTATFGLVRQVYLNNLSAADAEQIAQTVVATAGRAAGEKAMVAASIGPTARQPQEIEESQLGAAVASVVPAMVASGADFILLETQTSLREAIAMTTAVRRLTDLPLVVSFGFAWHGRTLDDFTPGQAVEEMLRFQPVALGCNCAPNAVGMVRVLQQMAPVADDIPILIRPNAGIPKMVNGKQQYSVGPERLADLAGTYQLDGARLIGGCCGTTPEHIAAVAQRLSYRPLPSDPDEY